MTVADESIPLAYTESTGGILVLSISSSLLGLFRPGHYTDRPALLARTQIEEIVTLGIGSIPAPVLPELLAIRYLSLLGGQDGNHDGTDHCVQA